MLDVIYTEHLTSAPCLDKRESADHYAEVMNHLGTEALTPAGSGHFLAEILREAPGHKLVSSPVARQADSRPEIQPLPIRRPQPAKDSL